MSRFLSALALAAALAVPAAHAQVAFGLKAGLNVSDFYGSGTPDTDPRLGFSGGVTADLPVTPMVSIRPELLYTQKGATAAGAGDATLAVDYVEVPVLVAVTVPATETGLMLGAYAGPTLAFKVNEELSTLFGQTGGDVFRDTDFGAALGVTVGAGPFAVDGRYTLGLQNTFDNNETRNGVFSVSAVYTFGR